jgi:hypothetical protein
VLDADLADSPLHGGAEAAWSRDTPVPTAVPASGSVNVPAGYASRRLSTQNVTASRMAASITKMPVSMPWNAQNLLAGW